jgi:hypothetical protein
VRKIYTYKVKLKSDIIVSADSNTEGFFKTLNFIPGSKFRGIVANQLFKNNSEDTISLFNGDVIFGNAYPFHEEKYYPIPLSLFQSKNSQNNFIYNFAIKENSNTTEQIKTGFISNSRKILPSITQSFKLKTAYDKQKGKSFEGKMFGYYTLSKGSMWYFDVLIKENNIPHFFKELDNHLTGEKWIGKSKSAEFGWIEILSPSNTIEHSKIQVAPQANLILYAISDLFLIDELGNNTIHLDSSFFGLDSSNFEIDYSKSFCKSSFLSNWNGKRKGFDSSKKVIQKGSVITFKNKSKLSIEFNSIDTIGTNISEGFGLVMWNPSFLLDDKFELAKETVPNLITYPRVDDSELNELHQYLKSIHIIDEHKLHQECNDFLEKNNSLLKISNSQWGAVKNKLYSCDTNSNLEVQLFDKERGFIVTGQSASEWRKFNNGDKLKNFLIISEEDYSNKVHRFNILLSNIRLKKRS